jgi:hypothetical protein
MMNDTRKIWKSGRFVVKAHGTGFLNLCRIYFSRLDDGGFVSQRIWSGAVHVLCNSRKVAVACVGNGLYRLVQDRLPLFIRYLA